MSPRPLLGSASPWKDSPKAVGIGVLYSQRVYRWKSPRGKVCRPPGALPGELHFQQHHATTRAKCCQPGELTPALASRAFIGVQSCRQTLASWSKTSGLSQITHSINSLVPLVPHGSRPQAHKKTRIRQNITRAPSSSTLSRTRASAEDRPFLERCGVWALGLLR